VKKKLAVLVTLIALLFAGVALAAKARAKKVEETLAKLAKYDEKKIEQIIKAIKYDDARYKNFGATFVRDAYQEQAVNLDTTECKMIWKAILVSCRTEQDGFDLMDIETPWCK